MRERRSGGKLAERRHDPPTRLVPRKRKVTCMSPTIHREGPYRFGFFANEGKEPPHIHVSREKMHAKFWLTPAVSLAHAAGFSSVELRELQRITEQHRARFVEAWNVFFAE